MLASKHLQETALLVRSIFQFIVSSSTYLAVVGASVGASAVMLQKARLDLAVILCPSLAGFSIYTFNKVTDTVEDEINNIARFRVIQRRRKLWLTLSLLAYTVTIALGACRNLTTVPVILIPLIAGFIYSLRIHPSIPRLKEIPGIKNLIVALSWSLPCALLPAIIYATPNHAVLVSAWLIGVMVYINTVIFDVRDMRGDAAANVKTLPIVLGVPKTRKLLLAVNLLLAPGIIASAALPMLHEYLPIFVFGFILDVLLIEAFCREAKFDPLLFDLMVDGEWMLLAAFISVLL